MRIELPVSAEPLVRVSVYMYPSQRRALREQAARRDMSMSEYLKYLLAKDRGERV